MNDPVYILGTTDYHRGRPARFIHWKATARHDRLQEKVFEPTRQAKALLVIDTEGFFRNEAGEALERTLEVAASLAVRLDRQGCAVGLLTNGTTGGAPPLVPISGSYSQLPAVLEALARLDLRHSETMAAMLERRPGIPFGTTCLYFALDEDGGTRLCRAHLCRLRAPVLFFTFRAAMSLVPDGAATAGAEGEAVAQT